MHFHAPEQLPHISHLSKLGEHHQLFDHREELRYEIYRNIHLAHLTSSVLLMFPEFLSILMAKCP